MPTHAAGSFADKVRRSWSSARDFLGDHPDLLYMGTASVAVFILLVAACGFSGTWDEVPIYTLYCCSGTLMFSVPIAMVANHRLRQARNMGRVRGLYTLAEAALQHDRRKEAERKLISILRWEQLWRIGNSIPYRLAYTALVMLSKSVVALWYS